MHFWGQIFDLDKWRAFRFLPDRFVKIKDLTPYSGSDYQVCDSLFDNVFQLRKLGI